jgi:hypothetical protein
MNYFLDFKNISNNDRIDTVFDKEKLSDSFDEFKR